MDGLSQVWAHHVPLCLIKWLAVVHRLQFCQERLAFPQLSMMRRIEGDREHYTHLHNLQIIMTYAYCLTYA
jgi:hypothetical protein